MNFLKNGIKKCGVIFNKKDCNNLLKEIRQSRNFNNLFLSKNVWNSKKYNSEKKNPGPGRNLLHKVETKFIFENKNFVKILSNTLGNNYRILDSKLVMGVPKDLIPQWILDHTKNNHTVNLGEYIKPEYRDVTYFRGIDFHQDIIDFPTRTPDFVTVYLYLDNVDLKSAPLYLLPNSHILGADYYPHNIKQKTNKKIFYKVNKKKLISSLEVLVGKTGSLFLWHPFILHGTQPHKKDIARISVRILAEKNRQVFIGCDLDKLNKKIKGKMKLQIYNKELNKDGINKKKNFINRLNQK